MKKFENIGIKFKEGVNMEKEVVDQVENKDVNFIDVLYKLKVDILTNSLSPKIKHLFSKNNVNGNRLKELDEWKINYLYNKEIKIPKELILLAKELRLYD